MGMQSITWTRLARVAFAASIALVSWLAVIPIARQPDVPLIDKIEHVVAFVWLSGCAAFAFRARMRAALWGLLAYGIGIECVQWWLPWREFSLLDWAADAAGIALWLALLRAAGWLRAARGGSGP